LPFDPFLGRLFRNRTPAPPPFSSMNSTPANSNAGVKAPPAARLTPQAR
jgi:hypothetical protein